MTHKPRHALCPECGMGLQGKTFCRCGWRIGKLKTVEKAPCEHCGVIINVKYLKTQGEQNICSDCFSVAQMDPADREYLRNQAEAHRMKLADMPTHLRAANKLNQANEDYLNSLPKSRSAFQRYWAGKRPTMGGRKLK